MPSTTSPNPLSLQTGRQQSDYEAALTREGRIDRSILQRDELLLGREGRLSVFYAPFDSVYTDARLVLLGLTPGWRQMCVAIETYRGPRRQGDSDAEAQRAVKAAASFAGMRSPDRGMAR
jgi:hypothetical protein